MCKAILAAGNVEELDFGDEEDNFARSITNDDINAILVCIDAVNNLIKLSLTGCLSVNGSGLKSLFGSIVLEEIDLSVMRSEANEDILPLLLSIIEKDENSLQFLRLPAEWEYRVGPFVNRFNELGGLLRHRCTLCFCPSESPKNLCECLRCGGGYCNDCNPSRDCDNCGSSDCCYMCCGGNTTCEECRFGSICPVCVSTTFCCEVRFRCFDCVRCIQCRQYGGDRCCKFCSKVKCEHICGTHDLLCEDCHPNPPECDCCGVMACSPTECNYIHRCEGCVKSNCINCFGKEDNGVIHCDDCGRDFCFDCRLSSCSENWEGACRGCAQKVNVYLPEQCVPVSYLYHSSVWLEVKAANPTAMFGELCAIIACQFKSQTKEERAYWNKKVKQNKENYKREMLAIEEKYRGNKV